MASVQIRAIQRMEYHRANQTDLHHTTVGGGRCRRSDPLPRRPRPMTIVQSPGNAQITAQPGMATQQAGQLQQPFGGDMGAR